MADGFASTEQLLTNYGLEELVPWAREAFQRGLTGEELLLELEQQSAYRTRFSAIFERRASGLPPITAAQVVDYERQARAYEQMYGMPVGFVDTNRLLVADVSATELNQRLSMTSDYVRSRTDVQDEYQRLYGGGSLTDGEAMALFLDPERAVAALTEQMTGARIAAEATRQGFGVLSQMEAQFLTREGLDGDQAAAGFATLFDNAELFAPLADESGRVYSREEQLSLLVGSSPTLARDLEQRRRTRVAQFQAGGGFGVSNAGVIGAGSAR
jgi:hypothetical protein